MRKITFLLIALIAGAFAMQVNAQDEYEKTPMRSSVYSYLPSGYVQAGESSIYYSIAQRPAAGPGTQWGISILGKIDDEYYSSTYGSGESNPGAGFITAFQVNNNTAHYLNSGGTTTYNGVSVTPSVEGQGDVAARIVYTITNNNNSDVNINIGAWADVYIGTNDYAPISRLNNVEGETYALDLKESTSPNSPLLCVLFGDGITGVTAIDDFWFGQYRNNYEASEIVGNYDNRYENIFGFETTDYYWMSEDGGYDSGMGMCWKNRPVPAGETIEISFLISVGNIPFDDPVTPDDPTPGQDIFTYSVAANYIDAWNDFDAAHPAHIWGHYEHPYGQEGYIEYSVDGGEWIRIPTPLTSGEDYDLPFDMYFDEDITTIHTLDLRFTLGLGSYTDLDGLQWVDVRSYEVEGVIPSFPYDGVAKTFEVYVNGEPVFVGAGGEYVAPGTYTVVVAEGDFYENTIGELTITFVIETPTGVEEVSVANEDNGAWYTIEGRRVAAPTQRGIYIHNGKKFVVM